MVLGDNLLSEIIIFQNITLPLVEEYSFALEIFSCPITKVSFKVCWSFAQKEHNCSGSICVQVVGIGNFSLEFNVN